MEGKKIKLAAGKFEMVIGDLRSLNALKMPYALAYWMARNIKSISDEARLIGEQKQKLLQDCALMVDGKLMPGEQPGQIKLQPDKTKEYWDQLRDIDNQEVDLTVWPIKVNQLVDRDGKPLEFHPDIFINLDFMFEGVPDMEPAKSK